MKVEWVELGDLLTRKVGEAVRPEQAYSIAGVYGFGRGLLLRDVIRGTDTQYKFMTRLSAHDVVYSKVKAFEGAVTLVPAEGEGRYVSPEFPVFALDQGTLLPAFAGHYLASETFRDQLRARSSGIGARRERVSPETFKALQMPLPSIDDQHRIAAHLDSLTAARTTDVSKQTGALLESLLSDQPWDHTLGDLLQASLTEVRVAPDETYLSMGVLGHGRGPIDRGGLRGADTKYKSMYRVKEGQVVFSRLKAFEGAVTMVPAKLDGAVVSKEFPVCALRDGVNPNFVSTVVRSARMRSAMASASVGIGARRERLSLEAFLALPAPRPPGETQERIGEVGRLRGRIEELISQRSQTSQALLPAARNEIFSSMR